VFTNNVWSIPLVGSRHHSLNGSSFSASSWNNLAETFNETHRVFLVSDLTATLFPTFNANIGTPIAGVQVDFNGSSRPTSGPWLVGAVAGDSGGAPPSGDVNGDGAVNVSDLLGVVGVWGYCSNCPGDVNHDGMVNTTDLLTVISDWN
jgi:hypothetical protein